MNSLAGVRDSARDLLGLIISSAHDPQCNSFRGTRTNSGHLSQLRNQISDCERIFRPSQNALGFDTANASFGGFIPGPIPLTAEQAAPRDANKIATEDRPLPPTPALFEIRHKLPPSVLLDTAQRHSKRY